MNKNILNSLQKVLIVFLMVAAPISAKAKCRELVRFRGMIDHDQKKLIKFRIKSEKTEVCINTDDPNANYILKFQVGKSVHEAKVFITSDGFYDVLGKNNKPTGGKYKMRYSSIEAWVPSWVKSSSLVITNIEDKKIFLETKL